MNYLKKYAHDYWESVLEDGSLSAPGSGSCTKKQRTEEIQNVEQYPLSRTPELVAKLIRIL